MALKFLSKKKWHVRRLENIRKVAEAEAKLAEEQTRMAELRREREEEREIENIRKIQEASGRIPKQQPRLEFLYKTPPVKKQSEEDIITTADILQGRRPDSILFNRLDKKRVELGLPGVKYVYSLELGKSDSNLKMREDPITGIIAKRKKMKQEQEEREAMLKKIQEANKLQNANNNGKKVSFSYNDNISNSRNKIDVPSDSSFSPNISEPAPPNDSTKIINSSIDDDNVNQDSNNSIDEETQRISAQMEAFERRQKQKNSRNHNDSSDSDDYSDEYERRRKKRHSSGHRHHHRHHHHHHRSNYSDYD